MSGVEALTNLLVHMQWHRQTADRLATGILASDWLATQIAAAEQRGREDEREWIADLDARCARAEEQLREGQAAHERNGFDHDAVRLSGKREGVALARDYLREIRGDRP